MGLGHSDNIGREGLQRILILGGIVLFVFLFIIIKLFSIQIINQRIYSQKAQQVSQRATTIPALRGRIYDRNNDNPIADNIESFNLYIIPAESGIKNPMETVFQLHQHFGDKVDLDKIAEAIPSRWQNFYLPVDIVRGISLQELTFIAENRELYPGIYWENRPFRYYFENGSINHILGYVGQITMEELQILYNKGYTLDSIVGKSGIERVYDEYMKGSDGLFLKTVDVRGRDLESNDYILPENGYDLQISIDRHIQNLAEQALGQRKGSIVVLKPASGEVVAMVSYPFYNPNLFYEEGPGSFKNLSLDRDYPFLNRAVQSGYAPASTYKILLTLALFAEGFDPYHEIYCSGSMTLGDREFHCHKKTGHGSLNLYEALAESCNVYFGRTGVEFLGIEKIQDYSELLGLGKVSGIDIPGEISGNIPSPQWKDDVFHTPWTGGDTLNASIGQGFLVVTPLQMANLISLIVNEGVLYKPHVLTEVRDSSTGDIIFQGEREVLLDIRDRIDPQVFIETKRAMREVVVSGTAKVAILNDAVEIAGKTGTGEVGQQENFDAWFVSYGPYNAENVNDVYVVVSQVEASNESWDWWAIKAADIVFQGIFSDMNYEEVIESMRQRYVWYVRDIPQNE